MKYLSFVAVVVDGQCQYNIINKDQIHIGRLEKVRVGQWLSWCLFLNTDCFVSAGCIDEISELDEVRDKIRTLNNNRLKVL